MSEEASFFIGELARQTETRQRIRELRTLERRLGGALVRASNDEAGSRGACRCPVIEEGSLDEGREALLPPAVRERLVP